MVSKHVCMDTNKYSPGICLKCLFHNVNAFLKFVRFQYQQDLRFPTIIQISALNTALLICIHFKFSLPHSCVTKRFSHDFKPES